MDLIIIIVGFYLIFSGFFSIAMQMKEDIIFQIGRSLRIAFGIFVVVYSIIWTPIGVIVDIFAMIIMADGLISILLQLKQKEQNRYLLIAERMIRILVGAYLFTYAEIFIV